MNLFTNSTDAKHQEMDEANNYSGYLSHADEPPDLYRTYEEGRTTPITGHGGSRNLFDDSDINDNYWLNAAKRYLRMYKL